MLRLIKNTAINYFLEKQMLIDEVKILFAFCGTQRFITVFTRVRHSSSSYSFNIQFNIIFQSNPRNSKPSSLFRFSDNVMIFGGGIIL
jgi:hypothetical protein